MLRQDAVADWSFGTQNAGWRAGKEALKVIAAAEEELKRREFPIPPEGEETAEWDWKKEYVNKGA